MLSNFYASIGVKVELHVETVLFTFILQELVHCKPVQTSITS